LSLSKVEITIQGGYAYLLVMEGLPMGSVFVGPLDGVCPNTKTIQHGTWGVENLPGLLYLQSLMIEPNKQGKGLGLVFLDGVMRSMKEPGGTIVLDCWAGNSKLRHFYEKAGFTHHGNFPENDYEISVYFRTLESSS
jgi:RimJ/RimL family protein N-acetyltransferase